MSNFLYADPKSTLTVDVLSIPGPFVNTRSKSHPSVGKEYRCTQNVHKKCAFLDQCSVKKSTNLLFDC